MMSVTFASLGLDSLSLEDKIQLIGELWDDLVAQSTPGAFLSESKAEELRRRENEALAKPDDWVSWDSVEADAMRRIGT